MKRKLSTASSRAELIASHQYGGLFAAQPPPEAAKPDAPTEKPEANEPPAEKPETGSADTTVTSAISAVKEALDAAIKAQQADPDSDDPKDKKVAAGLDQIAKALAQVLADQAADQAEPPEAPEQPATPKPDAVTAATEPAAPKTDVIDADGNAQPDAECANPDCGHLASSHADMPDGSNIGACALADCECLAFQDSPQPNDGNGDDGGQSAVSGDGGEQKLAGPAVADAPAPLAPASEPEPDLNKPPEIEGGSSMGPAFTIPVLIIEGQPTGDGRQIAPGALTWRTPPLPLMGLATETHDPNGFDLNDPAVLCGRIDSLERVTGEGDTQIIVAKGYFLPNDDGMYFAELTEAMGRIGVSGDVAVEASEVTISDVDEMGFPVDMSETLTQGVIMGCTIVPFPAFEGAYLVLGGGTDYPDARIPQRADGEEMPTVPDEPPAAVAAGGQLVHLMAYEDCGCRENVEIVASGAPMRPPAAWFENPNFHPDDGRMVEVLDRRGQRVIGGKYACPLTVEENGRIYGHIAPWGICHTGTAGQCILAPRSHADYAHFKRGQHLITAEGEKIRVGVITADAGHASTRGISASQAMAHYDNTALAVADVNIGEDEHGIWVAGALRPDATDEQVRKLRAASISGDWRSIGGTLELVAALAVNQPGFPIVQIEDGPMAMVAAGTTVMAHLKEPAPESDDPAVRAIRHFENKAKLVSFAEAQRQRARARLKLVN